METEIAALKEKQPIIRFY